MVIDVAFFIVIIIAVFKGISKGFVVGIFSLAAFIFGLAAALKLSAVVAHHVGTASGISARWLPVISFFLVFMVVVLLVNIGARIIRKTIRMAMLGWLDQFAGILLYLLLYTIIFSVLLFFAEKMLLIKPQAAETSVIHGFVAPWGPAVINHLGKIIPVFKDLFTQLQSFFETIGHKIAA